MEFIIIIIIVIQPVDFPLQPSWEIADPIISLVGACVVLVSTYTVLRDSINILLEGIYVILYLNN